ncbi:MAG TPA: flavodoxin [Clostridia bacterium]|nr:flavodoxin [Clostridia bacterium]
MKKQAFKILYMFLFAALLLSGCSTGNNTSPTASPSSLAPYEAAENSTKNSMPTDSNISGLESSQTGENKFGKVLVVYYSLTGHTREIGNMINDMTGGDVFEIQPVENYYRSDIEEIGKKQVKEGYKPKLKNSVSDIETYDLIFIGSPVWWFSVSPPVMSFLAQYDFKDKKVVPFCTYVSDYGDFFDMFKKACPGAEVLEGEDFTNNESRDTEQVKAKIKLWLKEIE